MECTYTNGVDDSIPTSNVTIPSTTQNVDSAAIQKSLDSFEMSAGIFCMFLFIGICFLARKLFFSDYYSPQEEFPELILPAKKVKQTKSISNSPDKNYHYAEHLNQSGSKYWIREEEEERVQSKQKTALTPEVRSIKGLLPAANPITLEAYLNEEIDFNQRSTQHIEVKNGVG